MSKVIDFTSIREEKELKDTLESIVGSMAAMGEALCKTYDVVQDMENQYEKVQFEFDHLLCVYAEQYGPENIPAHLLDYSRNIEVLCDGDDGDLKLVWRKPE